MLLAFCINGCVVTGLATGASSVAGHAASDLGSKSQTATNTPSATGQPQENRLPAIRHELAIGEYTKAHQDLALVAHYDKLTQAERREVADDLCLTEYLIGQGSYPWSEQQRTCSAALAEPGSVSGAILARIHDAMKQSAAEEVRRALEGQDLARAEAEALAYRASPGADSELLAQWSKDFWQVVHGQERSAEREQRLAPLITGLAKEYPQAKTLSEPDFARWAIAAATVSDKSVVASLTIKGDALDVLVPERDLPTVATNLYRFVRINDVFAAWCGCDARTNVGITDVGFPAYLFRLDPEERTSKVLIAMGERALALTPPVPSATLESVAQPVQAEASAPKIRPATESSQEPQAAAKPSRTPTLEGVAAVGAGGAVGDSSVAGSASSPQQSSPGEQPRLKSTRPESQSSSRPSSAQPVQGPTSSAEPQCPGFPTTPSDAAAHTRPTGASSGKSRPSDEATCRLLSAAETSFGSWRRIARLELLAQHGWSLSSWYGNKAPEATCSERALAKPGEQASLEGRERSLSGPENW
jgi:hypothetical protein